MDEIAFFFLVKWMKSIERLGRTVLKESGTLS